MTKTIKPRYTLDELKKKARLAIFRQKLVDLASKDLSPTTVMEIAESQEEYNEHQCRSVRYLSIMRRDYGLEVMNQVIDEVRAAHEEWRRNRRDSDEVMGHVERVGGGIDEMDSVFDYLATMDLEVLKEGFQRLPKEKSLKFYIRKLAGLQAKLRGLDAYAR